MNVETAARLQPFIEELTRNADVCTLPRITPLSSVQWYVLCRSARDERLAREELRAFLGPSYSNFDGQSPELDPVDPVDAAVLEHWGRTAFKLELPPSGTAGDLVKEHARERLLRWLRMRRERPTRLGPRLRATGRILRDFEYATLAGDGVAALACIEELRAFGRLDARNLQFLEVRRLASVHRWRDIRELPEFDSLLAIRRPLRVTESIIASIYNTEIEPFERERRADDAVAHFRQEIRPRFSELFRSRRGLQGEEVTASFVLAALTEDPPKPDAAAAIVDGFVGAPERRRWLETITDVKLISADSAEAPPTSPSIEAARGAFADGDIDRAIELTLSLPSSLEQATLLMRCAHEIGTIDLVRAAIDAVRRLSAADQLTVDSHPRLGRIWSDLLQFLGTADRSAVVETAAASWIDWLRRIAQDERWPTAVAVAELGSREWSVDEFASNAASVAELAKLISGSRPAWGEEALRDSSPSLIEALLRDGPRVALQPVYDELLLLLLTEPNPSLPSFRMLIQLVETRLTLAVDGRTYRDLVDGLGNVMDRLSSPAVCELALEALEGLINVPSSDRAILEGFVARTVALFARWYRRVDTLQRKLLARLADELGLGQMIGAELDLEPGDESDPLYASLQNLSLAMYSLNERALRRAAATLEHACPGVDISVFHDHVGGSPALRAAAVRADVFVLAIAAAKHAATGYIAQNRSKDRLTLYARGQGSAGLLTALRENEADIQQAAARRSR